MTTLLSKYDKNNMRKVILSVPNQFAEGLSLAKDITPINNFTKIVISGMGGSALPGDIVKAYYSELLTKNKNNDILEIHQNRSYFLPNQSYHNCLNIICSHSGNTEETIHSLNECLQNNLPTIAISAGGKIEKICQKNNITHIKLPIPFKNFQPRMATAHFVSVIIQLLINSQKIPDETQEIIQLAKKLQKDIPTMEKTAQEIAKKLINKTPVVYTTDKFKALAMIWKIKLNENSKTPAFWNYFPELNHNELVGFTNPQADYCLIMLQDQNDYPQILKRFKITAELLKKRGLDVINLDIPLGKPLYRIFASLALGDWVSYYLALEYGIDPTPVNMVEDFKNRLK